MPDVDIDFFDRDGVLKLFKHTPATIIKSDKTEKHKKTEDTLRSIVLMLTSTRK